jgi:hypothetical protein
MLPIDGKKIECKVRSMQCNKMLKFNITVKEIVFMKSSIPLREGHQIMAALEQEFTKISKPPFNLHKLIT